MATVVALAALGSAVLLDVVATVLLVRSPVARPLQMALQLMFTWAVRFVGSIIVIVTLKETISTQEFALGPAPGTRPTGGLSTTTNSIDKAATRSGRRIRE